MSNIGVEVSTTIRSGPTNTGPISGRFQIAAITTAGPVDRAVLVKSIAEYEGVYGPRAAFSSNGYDTARMFFEEGGAELIVSRAVGPAAKADSLILKDTDTTDTLRVEARSPGANLLPIKVAVNTVADTSTISVTRDGVTLAVFTGASPAELAAAAAKSPLVKIVDLGSETVAPGSLPITIPATDLTGGTDDRAAVTTEHIITALKLAGELGEGGAVAAPGYPVTVIGADLADYARANRRIALLAPDVSTSADALIALAPTYTPNGDSVGLVFPHVVIPDGSATRMISPEGYVAAVRARAHTEVGYWRKPFGDIAQARWVIGTAVPVNTELNHKLNDAKINGIVTTGTKVRLYGWTSLSINPEMSALSARDVLNNLSRDVKLLLEPYVGETIDGKGHLTSRIGAEVEGLLAPIADAGGFFALVQGEEEIDPGFRVIVDQSNNPISSLDQNILNVAVLVRLSPTADLIKVEIIKVPLQGTF